MGWMLFNVRAVDDGRFRRSVCEALCACYALQSIAVVRAQFTDPSGWYVFVCFGGLKYTCIMYNNMCVLRMRVCICIYVEEACIKRVQLRVVG